MTTVTCRHKALSLAHARSTKDYNRAVSFASQVQHFRSTGSTFTTLSLTYTYIHICYMYIICTIHMYLSIRMCISIYHYIYISSCALRLGYFSVFPFSGLFPGDPLKTRSFRYFTKQEWLATGRSEHQKLGVVLGGNNWKHVLLSFFVVWARNYTTLYTIRALMQLCAH